MKKVLFVSNTDMHINLCYLPYIKYFKDNGYIVHVATNTGVILDYTDKKIKIPIYRNPFHLGNIISILKLKKIILKEKYDLVSCSTPMGGVVARLASKVARNKYNCKVLYTVHGFHFFKGCKKVRYFIYYNIEKHLAKYTDILITINEEDFEVARNKFNIDVRYIPGIGYNDNNLRSEISLKQKNDLRIKLGIKKNDYVITYIAEISKRKRQIYLLDTLSKMNMKNIKVIFAGNNLLSKKIYRYIKKYKLEENIKVLGFRNDISEILDISDLIVSVSYQEGLPLNIMEAMHKKKPIVVTDCRGNRDLIKNNYNGYVVSMNNQYELIRVINYLKNNSDYAKKIGLNSLNLIKDYSIKNILPKYVEIYKEVL